MKLRPEPLQVEKPQWPRYVVILLIALLFGAAFFLGLDYSGKPSFCGSCHAMREYVAGWKKGKHTDATCVDCHQEPGVWGALVQRAEILKHYSLSSIYFKRYRSALATYISPAGCLHCHQRIISKTTVTSRGIKVRHKEIVEAGLSCGRCHPNIGHDAKSSGSRLSQHDYCFLCHDKDKRTRTRDCSVCHTRDPGFRGDNQIRSYRKVEISTDSCDGCHSTKSCGRCHPKFSRDAD